jgi:hypothetical protein
MKLAVKKIKSKEQEYHLYGTEAETYNEEISVTPAGAYILVRDKEGGEIILRRENLGAMQEIFAEYKM